MDGFVTLVYGVLTAEGRFTYASAGHETPILCREDGSIEMLRPTGLILGAVPEQSYGEAAVTLHSGDGLLLFTDGLSEARSPSGDFLDMEGLAPMVADCRRAGTGDFANALLERVSAFADGDLSDDVAMLWIERCPAREPALSTR